MDLILRSSLGLYLKLMYIYHEWWTLGYRCSHNLHTTVDRIQTWTAWPESQRRFRWAICRAQWNRRKTLSAEGTVYEFDLRPHLGPFQVYVGVRPKSMPISSLCIFVMNGEHQVIYYAPTSCIPQQMEIEPGLHDKRARRFHSPMKSPSNSQSHTA